MKISGKNIRPRVIYPLDGYMTMEDPDKQQSLWGTGQSP